MAEKTLFILVSYAHILFFLRKAGTIITASLIKKYKNRKKRKVTLDSNVLIAFIVSKRNNTIIKKVVLKSVTEDQLMLTDVIYNECLLYAEQKGARASREEVSGNLVEISPKIIKITPMPSKEELLKRYQIRDEKDLQILFSVDKTKSVILVTMDKDFENATGVEAVIMDPKEYLQERGQKRKKIL